jgi:predicted RNase H-like HicB family nuclease
MKVREIMDTYLIKIGKTNTGYSAHCPDVPGCAATDKSVEEVVSRMKEALALHFEGLIEDGEPIPKPRGIDSYREVLNDADAEEYLLAHVQMDTDNVAVTN